MAQDWQIRPRGDTCSQCGKQFEDGCPCYSALLLVEGEYTRSDYCVTCWEHGPRPARTYSTWRGTFRAPPTPEAEAVEKETAETLLQRLVSEQPDRHRNVIYILAVMLERKKVLIERAVQKSPHGEIQRVYEHRGNGATFMIPDPELRLDQLGEVQKQVAAMLDSRPPPGGNEQQSDTTPQASEESEDAAESQDDASRNA